MIAAPVSMKMSLVNTITKTQGGILKPAGPYGMKDKVMNDAISRNLSAKGSSNMPNDVICLYFLAIKPSTPSVITAVRNIISGRLERKLPSSLRYMTLTTNAGVKKSRVKESMFGMFTCYNIT